MSRKPPKLIPVPSAGKSGSALAPVKVSTCMPTLKQGNANAENGSSSVSSLPMLRRSAPTRNFLNCNGSTASNTRRRFVGNKFPIASPTTNPTSPSAGSSSVEESGVDDFANCDDSSEHEQTLSATRTSKASTSAPNKVNGTLTNGISSKKVKPEASKVTRRSKSSSITTESSTGGSQTQGSSNCGSTRSINGKFGKKAESNLSSDICVPPTPADSQVPVIVGKRTSRFGYGKPNSVVVSSAKASTSCDPIEVCVDPKVSGDEESMPALIAYETPNTISEDVHPLESSDSELAEQAATAQSISEEPKIIRRGDTVIKSYVDEKTGRISVFEKGMKLEVCDFGSGKWYPAKVSNVKWDEQEILVHYSNWSSRYDEWISMTSNRIRASKNTNVVRLQFSIDERVEAVWPSDNVKYSARITHVFPNDSYEVTFDDGYKMKKYAHQIFKLSDDELKTVIVKKPANKKVEPEPVIIAEERQSRESAKSQVVTRRRQRKTLPVIRNTDKSPMVLQEDASTSSPSKSIRPIHFSVFDLPQGDIGKRKRAVHDYSILVRGRLPQARGSRRPKSEGSADADDSVSVTSANAEEESESIANVPVRPESPTKSSVPPLDATTTTTEAPPNEPTSTCTRRGRKSTLKSNAPTAPVTLLSSKESPSAGELPVATEEVKLSEPVAVAESAESMTESLQKKRKHSSSTLSSPPAATTSLCTDTKSPAKQDVTAAGSVDSMPTNICTASATPAPTSSSRRTKSMGAIQRTAVPSPLVKVDSSREGKVDSGFIDEFGNPIFIEQNDIDGFWKCPLNGCGKNFRKDSLLKMHLKHYHPELKVTRGIANVVQMAQARTAFENDTIDHHVWSKIPNPEQSLATDSTRTTDSAEMQPSLETVEIPPAPKRTPKASHSIPKDSSCEKESPVQRSSDVDVTVPSAGDSLIGRGSNTLITEDGSKAVHRSPRLRVNRKRTLFISKRSITKVEASSPVSKSEIIKDTEKLPSPTIATDSSSKKAKLVEPKHVSRVPSVEINRKSATPTSPVNSSTNTPSDKKSDHYSAESGSSSEPTSASKIGGTGSLKMDKRGNHSRWSKSHIRRGLMNSNLRRISPGLLHNHASLFLKKRMQFRKFMGKRTRQKKTSILNRISSGRMRVILEALNQRSLKRKRFRAGRRFRDVKVDVINCICNNKTEFGLMIQCELCLCWQHGSCFSVQSNSQLPEYYACQSCSEPTKIRVSRRFEWAESEFFKLGKLPSFPFAPNFPKEDARVMKTCNNISSNLMEVYAMLKGLRFKERICFGHPEHPQMYQWNAERAPPSEEIQRDRFKKYFQPVLRRLLLENKSDPTYQSKLKKLAEVRMKLKRYAEAVDHAKVTLKKKLGCRAAAFLDHICDHVLVEMMKTRRRTPPNDDPKKETLDTRKTVSAEQAFQRLRRIRDEITQRSEILSTSGLPSPEAVRPTVIPTNSLGSPVKISTSVQNLSQPYLNSSNAFLPLKVPSPSQATNGLRRDLSSNIKDFCALRKYLNERRTVDVSINSLLKRMSKEFPEEWRHLIKISRGFVESESKETNEVKLEWVSNVIKTYNTLRILLRQIYSESNSQKQRNFGSELEKTTIKLFDLCGVGVAEEHFVVKLSTTKQNVKRVRGLETLDRIRQTSSFETPKSSLFQESDDSEKDSRDLTPTASTGVSSPPSTKEDEDLLLEASSPVKLHEDKISSPTSAATHDDDDLHKPGNESADSDSVQTTYSSNLLIHTARQQDGRTAFEFTSTISLLEAVSLAAGIPEEECTEESVDLRDEMDTTDSSNAPEFSGILPIPATSRITPDMCRKNLVKDILSQQIQIDLYLDKIETHLIKLSSRRRSGSAVSILKPSQLTTQRDKMLHSLELVARLTKTVIGENDIVEYPVWDDLDNSETSSGSSDMDFSSDSDDEHTSNYSGTDTETADEGDYSGYDDLLDV